MKGYKAFNKDLTCRGFQYEIGKEYEMEENPIPCERGFHFCKSISDCYRWYATNDDTRICEVEALGDVETDDEIKYCTNKIKIVAEITEEWQRKGNQTPSSSGYMNSGDRNSGDWNSGDRNSGDWNSGNRNSGDWNSGYMNSGDRNSGDRNSGYWNSGDRNSGDWNSGYMNSGDRNSGDRNSGYRNSGYRNSGDWNSGNRSSGVFNTKPNPTIKMFDKESDWTWNDWFNSLARIVMLDCPYSYSDFVWKEDMTSEEITKHPECETIGGYVKVVNITNEDKQKWWDGLTEKDKQSVMMLPNFDKDKFKQCTGIEV